MHNAEPMKPLEIGKPCASKGASTVWGEADGKGLSCETTCGDIRQAGLRNYQYLASRLLYFAVQAHRTVEHTPTGKQVGIDLGLKALLTDSEGKTVENPRYLRKAEKRVKRLQRRLSRTKKKSANRKKARQRLAKAHLKVRRRREDFARKTANTLVTSCDLIAYEDLRIANLVKNHKLAKSISDASWGRFRSWMTYYGVMHGIPVIAMPPQYTSQDCSSCGQRVQKTLSMRTHIRPSCGLVMDRDHNAACNILAKAKDGTVGHTGTDASFASNASGQACLYSSGANRLSKPLG